MNCPNCQRDLPNPPGKVCIHCGMVLQVRTASAAGGGVGVAAVAGGAARAPSRAATGAAQSAAGATPARTGTGSSPGAAGASGTGAAAPRTLAPKPAAKPAPKLPPKLPPKPARDPLVGTEVAGRFRIEELIGQGGMGKVYRARHLALEKIVCLKTLKPALLDDPTLVGRFEREAKAASRLNHPNVIAVLDFGRIGEEGTLYIAMEFVQGKDLRLVLRDEWPLAEDRLVHILAQVLGALGEAHSHNVIHRDLKPENIMLEQRRDAPDFVKVLDFGIAKIMDSDMPGLTRSDVVCGTPQYMAPEQATGSALDSRCDLYAVGVILYQMATGHLPFDGQNSMEVLTKHVNELPVPPRKKMPDAPISEALEKLILKALEKEPSARPQSAEEFRQLLLAVPAQSAAEKGRPPAPPPPPLEPTAMLTPTPQPPPLPKANDAAVALPAPKSKTPLYAGAAAAVVLAVIAAVALRPAPVPAPIAGGNANSGAASASAVGAASAIPTTPASGASAAVPVPGAGNAGTIAGTTTIAAPGKLLVPGPAVPKADAAKVAALIEQSSVTQKDGDTGAARDLLEQALQLDPDNAEAHFRLGSLFHQTKPQRAREEYELAKKLNPGKYTARVEMALRALE